MEKSEGVLLAATGNAVLLQNTKILIELEQDDDDD